MTIWNFIENELKNNRKTYLITVIERKGSSPGKLGYKMAVAENSKMEGSIGGGVMEVNMVEYAKKLLAENSSEIIIKRQIHNPDAGADKSGLICSGEQTHAFIPIAPEDLTVINSIANAIKNEKSGNLSLSTKGISFTASDEPKPSVKCIVENDNNWVYSEIFGKKDTMYIFGGGHVSIPVSKIFKMLSFKVVVCDNRKGLSTLEKNQYADVKKIIDYKNAASVIDDNSNNYVAIMTVSHAEDLLILEQMLEKKLSYLGMIGSKNKVKNIFEKLIAGGISKEALSKVDAPMGIPIKCLTTEEIAVSIAAKVIEYKNES